MIENIQLATHLRLVDNGGNVIRIGKPHDVETLIGAGKERTRMFAEAYPEIVPHTIELIYTSPYIRIDADGSTHFLAGAHPAMKPMGLPTESGEIRGMRCG